MTGDPLEAEPFCAHVPARYARMVETGDAEPVDVYFARRARSRGGKLQVELAQLGNDYQSRNVAIFAINSNDFDAYPGDSPANMKKEAEAWGYTFPYLVDRDQSVAKAYQAACTPDFLSPRWSRMSRASHIIQPTSG